MSTPSYITIRDSTIEGAGSGAFAAEELVKGRYLGDYTGKELDPNSSEAEGDYVLFIQGYDSKGKEVLRCIDAVSETSDWPRFINSIREGDGLKANCKFFINRDKVSVQALRVIAIGEELLVDYGHDYVF